MTEALSAARAWFIDVSNWAAMFVEPLALGSVVFVLIALFLATRTGSWTLVGSVFVLSGLLLIAESALAPALGDASRTGLYFSIVTIVLVGSLLTAFKRTSELVLDRLEQVEDRIESFLDALDRRELSVQQASRRPANFVEMSESVKQALQDA
jgi:hypothetical protein